MDTELDNDSTILETPSLKQYQPPNLTDYGKMSELTQAMMGDTGCDGSYPSYTASIFP